MTEHTALYEILGVATTATQAEIDAGWKAVARRLHPDLGGGADEFHEAKRAYDVLSDAGRRVRYDLTGDAMDDHERAADDVAEVTSMLYGLIGGTIALPMESLILEDVVEIMANSVQAKIDATVNHLASLRENLAKVQTMLDRKALIADSADVVALTLQRHERELNVGVEVAERQVVNLHTVLRHVRANTYRFDEETPGEVSGFFA